MSPLQDVTAQTLIDAGLGEDIDRELDKIRENIRDLNTNEKTKRVLTVKLEFELVGDSRQDVKITEQVVPKLAGTRKHSRLAMLDDGGMWMAGGGDPRQRDAFEDADDDASVTPISEKKKENA